MRVVDIHGADGVTPPHHYDMKSFKLVDARGAGEGMLGVSLSYYLPGAHTDMGEQPLETVYYVLSGELVVETEDASYPVKECQAIHIMAGERKRIVNAAKVPAEILVLVANTGL